MPLPVYSNVPVRPMATSAFIWLTALLVPAVLGAQTTGAPGSTSLAAANVTCAAGTPFFAEGPASRQLVTALLPGHVGDVLSVNYVCAGFLDALQAGVPFATRRAPSPLPATVTIGDATAQLLRNSLAGRLEDSYLLTFVVPAPLTGTSAANTTIWESALQVAIAGQDTTPQVLPIVYEPNGSYLGSLTASVTIVEYGDYQCPFCGSFYLNTWPQLKSEYVNTGKVRFLFQDMAFLGPDSTTAAEAAHCAGDQYRFWEYHDYLYAHQGGENSGWAAGSNLKQFAAALGLDTAQFGNCLDSGEYAQEVKTETAAGSKQKITGTPGFLINGTVIMGAQPISVFEQAINAALAQ